MRKFQIFFIFFLNVYSVAQNYILSLTNPSTFDNNDTNIMAIGTDNDNNFLVSLQNGQARRYDPTLASYINFTLEQPANIIYGSFDRMYNTSTTFISISNTIQVVSKNFTTLRSYDADSFNLLQTYILNDTLNNMLSFSFNASGLAKTCYFLFSQYSFQIAYNSTIVNFSHSFYNNLVNIYTNIVGANGICSYGAQTCNFTLYMLLSQSNNGIYQASYFFVFTLNSTTMEYALTTSIVSSMSLITIMPIQASLIMVYSTIILAQQNSTGIWSAYNTATSSFIPVNGLPNSLVVQPVFIKYSKLYILLQTGLSQISITSSAVSLVSTLDLPSQSYFLTFGSLLDIFFIIGQPYYYLGGPCPGQSTYNGATCVSFNCSDPNCLYCAFGPAICGVCNMSYYLTSNSTCLPYPLAAQSNSSSFGIPMKLLAASYLQSIYQFLFFLLKYFINIIKIIISVPGARRFVSPLFYYFGIFDDIYFYQFQDRNYGYTMQAVFDQLDAIQVKKWSFVSYQTVLGFFNQNASAFDDPVNYQEAYLIYNFTSLNHPFLGTESILGNCQNFVVVGLPMIILGFFFGRLLFRLTFKYPFSRIFRKFDFLLFIFLLIFDGNVQQFSFYLTRDVLKVFTFQFLQKFIKIGIIYFGLTVLLYSCSIFFLSVIFYKRLSFYFNDNNKRQLFGVTFLVLQYGFKNVVIGVMQSLLRILPYQAALSVLFATEVTFLVIFAGSIKLRIYKESLKVWLFIALNLIKISLIYTFFLDYNNINTESIELAQQIIIFVQIGVFCLGVVYQLILYVRQLRKLLIHICQSNCIHLVQQKRTKQNLDYQQSNEIQIPTQKNRENVPLAKRNYITFKSTKFQKGKNTQKTDFFIKPKQRSIKIDHQNSIKNEIVTIKDFKQKQVHVFKSKQIKTFRFKVKN